MEHQIAWQREITDTFHHTVFVVVILFLRLHRFLLTRRSQEVKERGSGEDLKGVGVGGERLKGVAVGGVKATATLITEEDSAGPELLRLEVVGGPADGPCKGGSVGGGYSHVYCFLDISVSVLNQNSRADRLVCGLQYTGFDFR